MLLAAAVGEHGRVRDVVAPEDVQGPRWDRGGAGEHRGGVAFEGARHQEAGEKETR